MLSDFLHTLAEFIGYLWPFAIVHQWENGLYLVFGRVWKVVGPGIYTKVPFFFDVHPTTTAWDPYTTPVCDVTTKDNRTLSFAVTFSVRVVDLRTAVVNVHDFDTMVRSAVQGKVSEELASVDPVRFEPEKRNALNRYLKLKVEQEVADVGLELQWLMFTTFVLNPKMFRLLGSGVSI